MTDTARLDAAHRANRREAWMVRGVLAVGVVALVVSSVLRTRREGSGFDTALVVAALLVVIVGVVMAVMNANTSRRHDAVRALRRHSQVIEVWGAAGLGDALAAEGINNPPVRRTQGTALSLTVTSEGFELWAGTSAPQKIYENAWSAVDRVVEGAGVVAGDGAKPAVVLVTRAGNPLVLLPARNPSGSLRAADLAQVRALVAELEEMRAAVGD